MTTPAPVFSAARRPRTPLTVDLDRGLVAAGGHKMRFDPVEDDAAYIAYLKLVRQMRDVHREPSFVLRRDDVESLALALRQDAVLVLERLGELMGATVTQRRSMVAAFLAGALLIAVATSAAALAPAEGTGPNAGPSLDDPRPGTIISADEGPSDDDRSVATGGATASVTPGSSTTDAPVPVAAAPAVQDTTADGGTSSAPEVPPAAGPTVAPPAAGPTLAPPAPQPTPPASPAPVAPAPDVDTGGGEPDVWSPSPDGGREVVQPGATIDIPFDGEDAPPPTVTPPTVGPDDGETPERSQERDDDQDASGGAGDGDAVGGNDGAGGDDGADNAGGAENAGNGENGENGENGGDGNADGENGGNAGGNGQNAGGDADGGNADGGNADGGNAGDGNADGGNGGNAGGNAGDGNADGGNGGNAGGNADVGGNAGNGGNGGNAGGNADVGGNAGNGGNAGDGNGGNGDVSDGEGNRGVGGGNGGGNGTADEGQGRGADPHGAG